MRLAKNVAPKFMFKCPFLKEEAMEICLIWKSKHPRWMFERRLEGQEMVTILPIQKHE